MLNLFQHPTGQFYIVLATQHERCRNKFGMTKVVI